jgi:hypothetical protein
MLLVLESYWSEDLSDHTSVFPFIDGWARLNDIAVGYRRYHDSKDLAHWLALFSDSDEYSVCYIAGHGYRGKLNGIDDKGINVSNLAVATQFERGRRGSKKGIFFGACEIGGKVETFLANSGSRIQWAAGYRCSVPWIESTLCDLKFLQYYFKGRIERAWSSELEQNVMLVDEDDDLLRTRTNSISKLNEWILEDFPMAAMFGLEIYYK